ncbi:MAG: TetR/AcrR family transcriptional regulator [Salaquimonas sp.]|jgi:AcrR family transcriptional regulator|nr:TetR/AcrR family transcriptional regulator [Salaquimonas sp.]
MGTSTRQQRTHKAILNAAEDLFLRDGFLGVSMDQVAETAAVSKQTVYAHFQSKEALFLAFTQALMEPAGDELGKRVSEQSLDLEFEDYLRAFAHQQLAIVVTPKLMQLRRLAIGEATRFPELGATLHKLGPARSINRLEFAFRHYRNIGQIRAPNLREAASNFNWLIMGAPVNDAMILGDAAIPGRELLEAHAEECVRVFLAAYGANPPAYFE